MTESNTKLDIYLIIGLTKESRHWSSDFIEDLRKKLNPNSIQLVDLPGSGKFLDQKSPTEIENIVQEARAQLSFNPGHQRLVIAISLGGMTAWSWTTQFPHDFTHMVMVNSSLGNLSPFWKRVQPMAMIEFVKIALAKKGKEKEKLILDLTANHQMNAAKIYDSWVKIGEVATMSFPNTLRQLLAGLKFKPGKAPQIPLLIVAAKGDRLAHYSCSEAIAQHASAQLVITDDQNVGHAFHVDAPEFLVDTILGWNDFILLPKAESQK